MSTSIFACDHRKYQCERMQHVIQDVQLVIKPVPSNVVAKRCFQKSTNAQSSSTTSSASCGPRRRFRLLDSTTITSSSSSHLRLIGPRFLPRYCLSMTNNSVLSKARSPLALPRYSLSTMIRSSLVISSKSSTTALALRIGSSSCLMCPSGPGSGLGVREMM